jgi:DNA-binding CsgD family transcriptional regulator
MRSPRLIGRQAQLTLISDLLQEIEARHPHLLLVAGEAGIGKSRLVQEAKALAQARGFMRLQANCFEPDQGVPYAPLMDMLEAWTRSAQDPASFLGAAASILVRWNPALETWLSNIVPAAPLEPQQERRRLFHSLTDLLIRLAAAQPLMLSVEDLQWSDEASLAFWLYLAHHLASSPLFLLMTYRSDQVPPRLEHFLAELDRLLLAAEIRLDRLTRAQVEEMIQAILAEEHGISRALVEPIFRLSEGNPLLVEEMLKGPLAAGELFQVDGQWRVKPFTDVHIPRSVQDAVHLRAAALGEPERHVLKLAAVAGQRFDFALLLELTGTAERELLDIVQTLIAAQLVVEENAERFAFRHAMTREAVYSQMLARERQVLHRAIAEAMERSEQSVRSDSPDARVGGLVVHQTEAAGSISVQRQLSSAQSGGPSPHLHHVGALAYHFYEAGVWDKALQYAQRAGEKAMSLYASREAVEHFTRALESAKNLPLAESAEIPELYRRRGQAHEILGDFQSARSDYERALAAARSIQDRRSEWQALLELGFLFASRDYGQAGEYLERALGAARSLRDPAALGHTLNRVGNWKMNLDDLDSALRDHHEALEIFARLNDRGGLAETLDLLGTTHCARGDLIQGAACYAQAIALFQELDDRPGLVSALASRSERGGMWANDTLVAAAPTLAEAAADAERALALASEIAWRSGEAYALVQVAMSEGARGNYGRALDLAHRGLAAAQEIEHLQWTGYAHAALGALYHDMFDWPAARVHLEQALRYAKEIGSPHLRRVVVAYLARTYVELDDPQRVESLLAATGCAEAAPQTMRGRACWLARCALALAQGRPAAALGLADELIAAAPNLTDVSTHVIPRLWLVRGECLCALRRLDEAAAVLESAREASQARGALPLLWRIRIALGRVYKLQRRRDAAEAVLHEARTLVEQLAAGIPGQDVRANFLQRASATIPRLAPASSLRAAKKEFGGLSARERQVAALIAQGHSNAEIARQLVVGKRTVESHIAHILSKLGFSSRAQVAAWAAEKRLHTPPPAARR